MKRTMAVRSTLLVLTGLLPLVAFAAEPAAQATAEIVGPDNAQTYRLIDHRVGSGWEKVIWKISPKGQADFRVTSDPLSVVWVGPPGTYTIEAFLINFSTKDLGWAEKTVTIGDAPPVPPGPGPGPGPDPPDPTPTDLEGQAKLQAKTAAAKLPADAKADAKVVGAIYANVAGRIGSEIKTEPQLIQVTRGARAQALTPAKDKAWEPWSNEVGGWINANKAVIKDLDGYRKVWTGIGKGLQEVQK